MFFTVIAVIHVIRVYVSLEIDGVSRLFWIPLDNDGNEIFDFGAVMTVMSAVIGVIGGAWSGDHVRWFDPSNPAGWITSG